MAGLKLALKIILGIFLGFLSLIVIAVVTINLIDWNRHRDFVAERIERHSDFQVEQLDHLEIRATFSPRLAIGGFKANSQNAEQNDIDLDLGYFDVRLALLPLILRGELHIENFILRDTVARIDLPEVDRPEDVEVPERDEAPSLPFVKSLSVENSSVIITQAEIEDEFSLHVANLKVGATDRNARSVIEGHFTVNENTPIDLQGELGSLSEYRDSDPYPINLSLISFDNQVHINSAIDVNNPLEEFTSKITVEAPNLSALLAANQLDAIEPPPVKAEVTVNGSGNTIQLADLTATMGFTHLYGDVEINLGDPRPRIDAQLGSSLLNLPDFLQMLPAEVEAEVAEVEEPEAPLFSDEPLPTEFFHLLNLSLRLAIAEIRLSPDTTHFTDFLLNLTLQDGILHVREFEAAGLQTGRIGGGLVFNAQNEIVQISTELGIRELEMSDLLSALVEEQEDIDIDPGDFFRGELIADVNLRSNGASMRDLASHLNGRAMFAFQEGMIAETAVRALGIDIPKTLSSWLQGNPLTELECVLAHFEVEEGVFNTENFIIATGEHNVFGRGRVSLREEEVDYRIETRAKDFSIGSTQSPIEIQGPLQDIQINVLTGELLARAGAAVVAGLINPALAIVPFIDLGLEEGRCGTFMTTIQNLEEEAEETISH